jgi:hypothetical protein
MTSKIDTEYSQETNGRTLQQRNEEMDKWTEGQTDRQTDDLAEDRTSLSDTWQKIVK